MTWPSVFVRQVGQCMQTYFNAKKKTKCKKFTQSSLVEKKNEKKIILCHKKCTQVVHNIILAIFFRYTLAIEIDA